MLIFAVENDIKRQRYGFDIHHSGHPDLHLRLRHNPPHIHVRSGTDNFSITIRDRIIEGKARSKTVKIINDFIDEHEAELMELWGRAQRGEKINKIK